MADGKVSRVDAWFAKNKEEALAALERHVAPADEFLSFATGWQYPLDVLTWLPLVGSVIEMTKKRYLLGVTRQKLVVPRVGKFCVKELGAEAILITAIPDSSVGNSEFFCDLVVTMVDGTTRTYKEVSYHS